MQVGVVHGGIGECGSKNFPGIYARLEDEDNLNFIRQATGLREYKYTNNLTSTSVITYLFSNLYCLQ